MSPIECFRPANGARIYRIPVEAFTDFVAYTYLLLDSGPPTLIDTGSGYGSSNQHLLQGLQAVHDDFGEAVQLADIERILITHGHIDHFGGVGFMLEQTGGAQVGIHPLDRRILAAYEERVVVATKALRVYLERAGVGDKLKQSLLEMYGFAKKQFRSIQTDIALEEHTPLDGLEFIHVPGHCPGQVCIKIDNILISADHVLAMTTPHQAPESITQYTGLGHYLESLDKIRQLPDIELALGGHEAPIDDLYARIDAIKDSHAGKLDRVLDIIRQHDGPVTISDISKSMYPDVHNYHILLALEEVGAHVEHLYQHGQLAVSNLGEVEKEDNPALRYAVA